jgi:hypothetical protein
MAARPVAARVRVIAWSRARTDPRLRGRRRERGSTPAGTHARGDPRPRGRIAASAQTRFLPRPQVNADARRRPDGHFHPKRPL